MFDLVNIGEKTIHDASFEVNRPNGYTVYLILFVQTCAELWVDDDWVSVEPGSAIVFLPGQAHRYRASCGEYMDSWMWANFQSSMLDSHFPYGRPVPLHHLDTYTNLFHILYHEYYSVSPHRDEIIQNLGGAILNMLSDEVDDMARPELYYALVHLRREIYRHPEKEWSVPVMAEQVSVSAGYLQKIYKEYFGITCNNEIIQSRIQSACQLLGSTTRSVEEVAEKCGYHNTEHFIRQFKSFIGVTPGQYRKQLHRGER